MFWTILGISGNEVSVHGVYSDRKSAIDARDTIVTRGTPSMTKNTSFVILEWLSVYGYNQIIGPDGKTLLGVSFFDWIHAKGNTREYMDALISACSSAVEQYIGMRRAGSWSK